MRRRDKKGEFRKERMSRGVVKIPIPNTSKQLEGMDFLDNGRMANFFHVRDTFRVLYGCFAGAHKKEEQTAVAVRDVMISHWVGISGAIYHYRIWDIRLI